MSDFIQITTKGGERWDNIALDAYGDAFMMGNIINANPDVATYDILPAGIVLDVPIIPAAEVKTDLQKLPPWKR